MQKRSFLFLFFWCCDGRSLIYLYVCVSVHNVIWCISKIPIILMCWFGYLFVNLLHNFTIIFVYVYHNHHVQKPAFCIHLGTWSQEDLALKINIHIYFQWAVLYCYLTYNKRRLIFSFFSSVWSSPRTWIRIWKSFFERKKCTRGIPAYVRGGARESRNYLNIIIISGMSIDQSRYLRIK